MAISKYRQCGQNQFQKGFKRNHHNFKCGQKDFDFIIAQNVDNADKIT